MNRPAERHRHGIQSASLVFVCTLAVGVVAMGVLALNQLSASATETTPGPFTDPLPVISSGYSVRLVGSNGAILPNWTGGSFPFGQPVRINFTVQDDTIPNMTVTSHTSC